MTRIRLENITKAFGSATIIKGLNCTIEEGEFFTFVGPSGCGKSTLLNIIAGLEAPDGGRIFFDDREVGALSPKDRDVAMVFQSYALYPHLSVYDNIAFPLRMKREKEAIIDGEVRRVATLLSIEDLLKRKPKELSGGQRQRVALGRAIVRKPRMFLMDEPLSNLDARLRIEMRSELKKLHRELGITIVYVTHDQAEAMSLSDRIAVLHQGAIQQCDTPREVYRNPANIFVGGFIGSPPMNFLQCSVKKSRPLEIDCNGTVLSPATEISPGARDVLVGVRPEDMVVESGKRAGSIEVTVAMNEPAGSFNWVDVRWAGVKVRATTKPEEDLRAGARAYLTFPSDRITVFDGTSGVRL
jgi:multiple sugar transport system ATP-binding protein